MALLGTNNIAGHVWPGQLECYRIDAPGEQWVVDPTLPVLSYDPRFDSDGVVIGRGRLVGPKATAVAATTGITQSGTTPAHKTVLTVADGVNVAPVGYAPYNIFKEWSEKAKGMQPIAARNHAIAVPYVEAVANSGVLSDQANSAYGALKQGDKVTAYYGCAQLGTIADPRLKGMVVKWVPKKLYVDAVTVAASACSLANAIYAGIAPRVLLAMDASGVPVDISEATLAYNTTAKKWVLGGLGTSVPALVVYEYGQGPEMIAGEVYGLETLTDMPGYLKWVTDNFGAWSMPYGNLTFPQQIDSTKTVAGTAALLSLGDGAYSLNKSASDAAVAVRIDGSKPIVVTVSASGSVYVNIDGTLTALDAGAVLERADFPTADYTQGKHYTVNPVTGVIQFFGLYTSTGAALTATDVFTVSYYKESSFRPTPDYATGQVGLTDGQGGSGVVGTEPQFDVTGSIGILRVAIH